MSKDSLIAVEQEGSTNGRRRSSRSQRIQTREYQRLHQLFWKPSDEPPPCKRSRKQQHGSLQKLHDSPHIYVMDDFLKRRELDYLTALMTKRKFLKSFVDDENGKRTVDHDHRTSSFVSLGKQENSIVCAIERRAADLLGMSVTQLEPLQLVRYREGEFFGVHHDLGTLCEDGSVALPPRDAYCPRRMATIFCYLNCVELGGCTHFVNLELRVQPREGRALLFSNILENGMPDRRTVHAGEPPVNGIKYGLNIWACES